MSLWDNLKGALNATPITPAANPVQPLQAPAGPSQEALPGNVSQATWDAFEALLKLREGCRLDVYEDSLGKPTVGIGHLVTPDDNLKVGDKVTQEDVDDFFQDDAGGAMEAAVKQAAEAGITDPTFLPYLGSVCFQLGNAWTSKFPNTWRIICKGDYATGAAALRGTAWAKQTPVRVGDFVAALLRLPKKPGT